MKKFYILLAILAVTLSAQARKITFYMGDQLIETGSEVEFNEVSENELSGAYQFAPDLYIMADLNTKNCNLDVECTTGQSFQLCVGDDCANGTHITKKISLSRNQKTSLKFEYVDDEAETPESMPHDIIVKFSGIDGTAASSRSEFTLVLNKTAGIGTLLGDKPEVRVSRGTLVYKVNGNATLNIYNILGVRAMQAPVSDAGTISLEGLPKGIYVYTIEGDTNISGKLKI